MTDEELKKLVASLTKDRIEFRNEIQKIQKETDRRIDKLIDSQRESFKALRDANKELGKMVGGISNSQGDVAEEFFYNSLASKPKVANITYDFIQKNLNKKQGKHQDEFDLIMVNGTDVLVIETKYKAHRSDLDRLLDKKFPSFKILFSQYKNYQHHLGLASFHINDKLKKEALDKNVIVLQRKGKVIEASIPKKK